jgi:Homeodomain-like domain
MSEALGEAVKTCGCPPGMGPPRRSRFCPRVPSDLGLGLGERFCREGLAGLVDRPRSGRPRVFGSEVVAGIKALACEPPERRGVALARWSSLELAAHAVSEGLVETISSSTVRR